jgi:hypothetical protein
MKLRKHAFLSLRFAISSLVSSKASELSGYEKRSPDFESNSGLLSTRWEKSAPRRAHMLVTH